MEIMAFQMSLQGGAGLALCIGGGGWEMLAGGPQRWAGPGAGLGRESSAPCGVLQGK